MDNMSWGGLLSRVQRRRVRGVDVFALLLDPRSLPFSCSSLLRVPIAEAAIRSLVVLAFK